MTETILEKKITKQNTKKRKKNHVGNTVAIHSVLWWKLNASPHDLALLVMTCNCNSQTTQY